jgi:hypothetical protein
LDVSYAEALSSRPRDFSDIRSSELRDDSNAGFAGSPVPGLSVIHPLGADDEFASFSMEVISDHIDVTDGHLLVPSSEARSANIPFNP